MIIKMTHDELAATLADKLTSTMNHEDLETFFAEYHYDYYSKHASQEDLINEAYTLGIVDDPKNLEIMDG